MKQKQRCGNATTLNGKEINNVALNRSGVPQLGANHSFLTIGKSGSVKDRSKKVEV
jgi:hypothetical protein